MSTDTDPKGETGAFDAEALAIVRGHYNSTDATAARAIAAALQRAHDAGVAVGLRMAIQAARAVTGPARGAPTKGGYIVIDELERLAKAGT